MMLGEVSIDCQRVRLQLGYWRYRNPGTMTCLLKVVRWIRGSVRFSGVRCGSVRFSGVQWGSVGFNTVQCAFVNFFGKRDGLVHVSQIANKRLNHPNEALKEGQEVKVKLLGFDDRGKVKLGMKMVDQDTGLEISEAPAEA